MIPLMLVTSLLVGAADGGAEDYVGAARAMANELATGNFTAAVGRFDPSVAKRMPAATLSAQWQQLTGALGAFKGLGKVRDEAAPAGGRLVFLECGYERGSLHLKIGLDEKLQVVTLRPVPGQPPEAFEAAARAVVEELASGAYRTLAGRFSPEMAAALPAKTLAALWNTVTKDAGPFQRSLEAKLDHASPPLTTVDLTCAFAKKDLTLRVVLDNALVIQGLFIKASWAAPDYATPAAFEERPLTVGSAALPLPGILTLPRGTGPFAAVVLVHGSGPNDADASVGPNRIFKDLAWGLASQNIAVLRYPKRTFHYRGKLSSADLKTVKDETIDDAVSAVAALAAVKELDPTRLFVAGHSMGASLAPRIAAADPKVRGIVLLAPSARRQWHLVVEQTKYLLALQGAAAPAAAEAIRLAEESAKKLDDPALKPTDVVDGIEGTYWLDLRNDDPVGAAAKLGRPILVLQGERDYQVTMTDFALWKKGLAGKKHATLKSYPALNHLFLPGTGKSSPAEYQQPGHVPKEVIDALARWLREH